MAQETMNNPVLRVPMSKRVGAPIRWKNLKITLSTNPVAPITPVVLINFFMNRKVV